MSLLGLSAEAIHPIPRNCHEDDFAFIVGDKKYHSPCFVAEFLSPRISQLRPGKPALCECCVNPADSNKELEDYLSRKHMKSHVLLMKRIHGHKCIYWLFDSLELGIS
jgi:hypothetical protein